MEQLVEIKLNYNAIFLKLIHKKIKKGEMWFGENKLGIVFGFRILMLFP